MRGTIYTVHYILSKGAMKFVWDIVSVHVSLHGISDCRCCYKASANEFCQRQLQTWWNGQRGDEKLALCALGRCCTVTPSSISNLGLTSALCPKIQVSVPSSVTCLRSKSHSCSLHQCIRALSVIPVHQIFSMAQSNIRAAIFLGHSFFCGRYSL